MTDWPRSHSPVAHGSACNESMTSLHTSLSSHLDAQDATQMEADEQQQSLEVDPEVAEFAGHLVQELAGRVCEALAA